MTDSAAALEAAASRRQRSTAPKGNPMSGTYLHGAKFIGPTQSHRYRALFLDGNMEITHIITFAAADDEDAAEMTCGMVDGATELWDRSRFIQSYAVI